MTKKSFEDDIENLKKRISWMSVFSWFDSKFPNKRKLFIILFLVIMGTRFLLFFFGAGDFLKEESSKILGSHSENSPSSVDQGFTPTPAPDATENSIQKRMDDERVDSRCKGGTFYPILDFDIVGEELFNYIDKQEQTVSVEGLEKYQAEVRTQWECPMPFKVVLRFKSLGGESIGVFIEYQDIFKFIIGDGDKRTLRLKENDTGLRTDWRQVFEERLDLEIKKNEETILTLYAKEEGDEIAVKIIVQYASNEKPQEYLARFSPSKVITNSSQQRKFRLGINDWRYKGLGSKIQFDIFSVTVEDWE